MCNKDFKSSLIYFSYIDSCSFPLGMFPWVCLATMPIFCETDWPRKVFRQFPVSLSFITPADNQLQRSSHCIYEKEDLKPETGRKVILV